YRRVKQYVAEARPKIAAEQAKEDENSLAGLHRRFEVVAGAQAQVDWGEESGVLIGTPKACSFHMVLSYSRDPFCCYTARTDLATFFGCHIRAFEYFGGVPGSVVYDRTKTAALRPLPASRYLVAGQHLRRVGKDCLISFEASMYPVPAGQVRPFQMVQVRAGDGKVAIYALPGDGGGLLAAHARAARRGSFMVDEAHWDGLPDGHTRAVTAGGAGAPAAAPGQPGAAGTGAGAGALGMLLASHPAANAAVARRPLSDYE